MKSLVLMLSGVVAAGIAPDTWLARVNDDVVTVADLRAQFTKRHGGHQKFLAGEVEARRFLDVVVDQRLLIQEAYRLELDEHDVVKASTERFSEDKQIEHLLRLEIDEKVAPTEDEARAAWQAHTRRLVTVLQLVTRSREEAEAARRRIEAGEDFEAVARELSIASSRIFGGRLHGVGWGTFSPEWEAAVFALQPGEMTPVMEAAEGFEVVRLESTRDVEPPEWEKARTRIEAILRKRNLEERRKALSAELWGRYHARTTEDPSLAAVRRLAEEAPDTAIATWDGGRLTAGEVAADIRGIPDGPLGEREWRNRLRTIVNRPLGLLEAKARRYAAVAPVVEAVLAHQEDLMEGVLYKEYVLRQVAVTDEEVTAWYEAHRSELVRPERRRIAQILVASVEEATALREELASGRASFDDLARERSRDAQTAARGGDLGWIERRNVPEALGSVLALSAGEISEPLATEYGVHLFRVTAVEAETPMSFEEARPDIEKKLLQETQRAARKDWVAKLRSASKVKVNDAGIRRFVEQAEAEGAAGPAEMPAGHGASGASRPHP